MKWGMIGVGAFFVFIILLKPFCPFVNQISNDTILAITAIIALWYAIETYRLRKTDEKRLERNLRPVVGCYLDNKVSDDPMDIFIFLKNQSDSMIAVKINVAIKLDDLILENFHEEYRKKRIWNLSFDETKRGHFHILDIFMFMQKIKEEDKRSIRSSDKYPRDFYYFWLPDLVKKDFADIPKVYIDVEIESTNEDNQYFRIPSIQYVFDFKNNSLVHVPTHSKPYWELGNTA